jgi:hypothetical protein
MVSDAGNRLLGLLGRPLLVLAHDAIKLVTHEHLRMDGLSTTMMVMRIIAA